MKVLLVDDDQALLTVFETSLAKDGFEVIKAEDGKTGLEMARSEKPDFIFLDQILPDMKGNDVLKALKADEATKSLPVAMLSNFGQQELMQEALAVGAVDYILKYQVDPADLSNKIKTHTSSAKPIDDTAPIVAPQAVASIDVEPTASSTTAAAANASTPPAPAPTPVAEPIPTPTAPVASEASAASAPSPEPEMPSIPPVPASNPTPGPEAHPPLAEVSPAPSENVLDMTPAVEPSSPTPPVSVTSEASSTPSVPPAVEPPAQAPTEANPSTDNTVPNS